MLNRKLFYPFAVLVGTIIGVGLFGLPYIAMKTGILVVVGYFILISCLVIFIHLLFGEVILRTRGIHRLPGYVGIYLKKNSKKAVLFSTFFGFYGLLLAYLIIGGKFLYGILNPLFGGNSLLYVFIFFAFGSFLIWRGIGSIAKVEFWFLGLFFLVLFILIWKGGDRFHLGGFILFDAFNRFGVNFKEMFLPYGVVMFSLFGLAVIPEIRDLLKGMENKLKPILINSVILAASTYLVFTFIILAISGARTTPDALIGLKKFLPYHIIAVILFFGVVTSFTSYLTLGLTLKKIFYYDYKKSMFVSWLLSCIGPFLLYVFGFNQFIKIIGMVGGLALGIEGTLILLMHQKAKKMGDRKNPEYSIDIPSGVTYILSGLLIFGVVLQISYSLIGNG